MSEKKLFKTFVSDSRNFIDNMVHIIDELKKNPGNNELITQAFRNAHSLKSEAAFLKEEEVLKISHSMESILEKYRKRGAIVVKPDLDKLKFSIDRVNEIIDYYHETVLDQSTLETMQPKDVPEDKDTVKQSSITEVTGIPTLTAFEKTLLREARNRDEKFYRLTFEIDKNFPMKYAKAFLVISNLEMLVNVVRTIPVFGEENEELYERMNIFFTSGVAEKEIYRAVNVDQVTSIKLAALSYDMFLKDSSWEIVRKRKNNIVKVESEKLDQISNYIDEIKIDIYRVLKNLDKIDRGGNLKIILERVKTYSEEMEGVIKAVEMVSLKESFSCFERYVRDLAGELHKKAELKIEGADVKISRKAGEIISEIVIHLLRNAVDHGIELPGERDQNGKPPTGKILLKVEQEDDVLRIIVEDDGRGIDRELVASQLTNGEIDLTKNEDLLKVLTRNGNSTKEKPGRISGRGIGLDIVAHKIGELQGGKLLLNSTIFEGSRFTLIIPGGFALTAFQLVRSGTQLIAVPKKNIKKIMDIQQEHYSSDSEGALVYKNLPVFSTDGRIFATDIRPAESKGIYLSYLGKNGIFLFDEILFEKYLSEQDLTLVIEDNQYLYRVLYGENNAEYMYLNPAIVAG